MLEYRGKWRITTEHGTVHLFDWNQRRYCRLPLDSPNKIGGDGKWIRIIMPPPIVELGEPFHLILDGKDRRRSTLVTKIEQVDSFD